MTRVEVVPYTSELKVDFLKIITIVTHYIEQHWLHSQQQIRIVSKLSTFRLMNKCKEQHLQKGQQCMV